MWTFLKKHVPKKVLPHLELFSKYLSCYSNSQFYWQLTIFQFFTKTRLGYWFYWCSFIFSLVQAKHFFIVIILLGCATNIATLKGSSKLRAFLEKTIGLNPKIVDNSIKDSPSWIMASAYRPALMLLFLFQLVDATEADRIKNLNKFLFELKSSTYINGWESGEEKEIVRKVINDIINMPTPSSSLAGGLSRFKDNIINFDFLSFSFPSFILITLVILLLLQKILENRRKK